MTRSEIVKANEAPSEGALASLATARRYLTAAHETKGLVPEEAVEAPGHQESSGDYSLLQRIASVLCSLDVEGEEEPDRGVIVRSMEKAGIPAAVYWQAADDPRLPGIIERKMKAATLLPQLPNVMRAAVNSATAGNTLNQRFLLELGTQPQDDEFSEHLRLMDRLTDDALVHRLLELNRRISGHMEALKRRQEPGDVKRDALRKIKEGAKAARVVRKVNPEIWQDLGESGEDPLETPPDG